jgi:hypothetical protein
MNITPVIIAEYLLKTYPGLSTINTWGEISFFYNPDGMRPRGTYFCTIKEKDGENDKASGLNRENTFRFNFGISKDTFIKVFGKPPRRPSKGGVVEGPYDFMKTDILQPHPVYGWMNWVAIINPTAQSFDMLHNLLNESYQLVLKKHQKKFLKPLLHRDQEVLL